MTELTGISFWPFVREHRFAVVHFWAEWNSHDIGMQVLLACHVPPHLATLVAFGSLDVDPPEDWDLCKQHHVLNIPFFGFYRDGTLVHSRVGALSQEKLIEHLHQLVA